MNAGRAIAFHQLPSMAGLLVKALTARKPGLKDDARLASMALGISGLAIDPRKLSAYNRLCGFGDPDNVPATYFYVLAQRAQLMLLTNPEFPLRAAGLIHTENILRQHGPVMASDVLDLDCRLENDEIVAAGRKFEVSAEFYLKGERVFECRSRILSRRRSPRTAPRRREPFPQLAGERVPLALGADAGRRYAAVSGDYNPIHLHPATARWFGFKRPIAHGMHLHALACARLANARRWDVQEWFVAFRRPVPLPASLSLIHRLDEDGAAVHFEIRSQAAPVPHLTGWCRKGLTGGDSFGDIEAA